MKKFLTILLALCMVATMSVTAFAAENDKKTDVTYDASTNGGKASAEWTVTVPASLTTGGAEGEVKVEGYWAPSSLLTVSTDETVTMYLGGEATADYAVVPVDFAGISKAGSYTESVDETAMVSVDDYNAMSSIKFGVWEGTVVFNVALVDNPNYTGGNNIGGTTAPDVDDDVIVEPSMPATSITSTELVTKISEASNGVVELTDNVIVSETITISSDITLKSTNGARILVAEGFNNNVFSVGENVSLTLDGVGFKNIVLTYEEYNPALVSATTNAKVTFKDVFVSGCTAHIVDGTGAEFVFDAGTVMTGNAFQKKSGQGGSIATISGGKIVINDGVLIDGNTSAYARDGLFAAIGNGDIVMNGGKISNNEVLVGTVGSVLYIQGTNGGASTASITMNGGEISNNKGILASAVVSRWCNGGTCSITLNAGTIKGNTTTSNSWNNASVFYRCDTTIGADMVIDGVVYGDENEKNGWTLTDYRT